MRSGAAVLGVGVAVLASLASACAGDPTPGGPDVGATSGGPAGSARLVDDTGRDDVPDGGGWVALIPADRVAEVWQAAGSDPGADLTYAAVTVTSAQVEAVGGLTRPVSEDGSFELGLTGPVVVCRVPGELESGSTRGCARVQLDEDSRIEISWGEAGFRVSG